VIAPAAFFVGLLAFATAGAAQPPATSGQQVADSALEARTSAVAAQLRCPVCQGLSIQDSPSELSQQMRDLVREQLRQGKTPEEVKAYFVSKYGEWILLEPKPSGFNLLVYALPIALVLGGGAVIVVVVRRWTGNADPA
jgi:cytochrome c-type biogenesis protein CcmH